MSKSLHSTLLIAGIVCGLIVAACSSTSPSTSSSQAPAGQPTATTGNPPAADPCSLLTVAEVEETFDWPGLEAKPESGSYGPYCSYRDPTQDFGVLSVELGAFSTRPCDQYKEASNSEPVADVGDWAYYAPEFNELYVKVGDRCLVLDDAHGQLRGSEAERLGELAKKAVARL